MHYAAVNDLRMTFIREVLIIELTGESHRCVWECKAVGEISSKAEEGLKGSCMFEGWMRRGVWATVRTLLTT